MRIIVFGGAGFIGSHTVKALLKANHQVTIFDSFEKGNRDLAYRLVGKTNCFEGSILDGNALTTALQPGFDAAIHFAAYIEAGESVTDPCRFYQNNTAGSINVINALVKQGVNQIVFSSTAAVYGNPTQIPIPESAPLEPTNPYGESKRLVEKVLADVTKATPLKATILRYFNAAGADPDGEMGENHEPESHLIPLVLQVAQDKRHAIKIYGSDYPTLDGTCVRDYIHVTDLANAHVLALESQTRSQDSLRIFNVGTGRGYSVKEVIEMCRNVTNHPIPVETSDRRPGDPAQLVADPQNITQKLGWQPHYSDLQTIIKHAWQWQNRAKSSV